MVKDLFKSGRPTQFINSGLVKQVMRSGFVQSVIRQAGGPGASISSDVLIESGSYRLLENGSKLILG